MSVSKKTEVLANIAIICVSLLLGIVLVKRFLWPRAEQTSAPPTQQQQRDPRVPRGAKVSLPNTDWLKNHRTLILAISDKCRYCTESGPFYKDLMQARANKNVRVIAVFPQPEQEGKAYLDKLGVSVDEIRQATLESIGVSATPTLIMVDESGTVIDSWVGKLPSDKEAEVKSRLS